MRIIKASEIGAYLYCHRAWWYAQKGFTSANLDDLVSGVGQHELHGKRVRVIFRLQVTALVFFLMFLGLITLYWFTTL